MGVLISFSGIDGSGKSTQVKLLAKYLRQKKESVLVTEEMFSYFLLKPVIGLLRKATGSPKSGPVNKNKKSPALRLWFLFAFIDIWLSFLCSVKRKKANYDFILADRFYTDIWANLLYYGYIPTWAFRLFMKILPKPDLAIWMKIDPGKVLLREEEFASDYYHDQAGIYSRLSKLLVDLHVVNAGQDKKKVLEDIKLYVNKFL